jgi:hypothetical protein
MTLAAANITTVVGNVYVSGGNTAITFLSFCNYSSSNVVANVWVVPSGNSVANGTAVLSSLPVTALDTYQFSAGGEKLLLSNGDTVQANCSSNNAITTMVSYTTI